MPERRFTFTARWFVFEHNQVETFTTTVVETCRARARVKAREQFSVMAGYSDGSRIPDDWLSTDVLEEAIA